MPQEADLTWAEPSRASLATACLADRNRVGGTRSLGTKTPACFPEAPNHHSPASTHGSASPRAGNREQHHSTTARCLHVPQLHLFLTEHVAALATARVSFLSSPAAPVLLVSRYRSPLSCSLPSCSCRVVSFSNSLSLVSVCYS